MLNQSVQNSQQSLFTGSVVATNTTIAATNARPMAQTSSRNVPSMMRAGPQSKIAPTASLTTSSSRHAPTVMKASFNGDNQVSKIVNQVATSVDNFVNPQSKLQFATGGPSIPAKGFAPKVNNFKMGQTNMIQQNLTNMSAQSRMNRDVVMKASTNSFVPGFNVSGSGGFPVQKNF